MAGRARAELAAKNNPQLEDSSWKVFKDCQYCGRSAMMNNYEDRKTRTTKFLGLIICAWCDPRIVEDRWLWRDGPKGPKPRITNLAYYRTCVSVWVTRQLAKGRSDNETIIFNIIQKYWDDTGLPRES